VSTIFYRKFQVFSDILKPIPIISIFSRFLDENRMKKKPYSMAFFINQNKL